MQRRALLLALCLLGLTGSLLAQVDAPAGGPRTSLDPDPRRVMVVAHRGGGFFAPENTLAAIEVGIEVGVDGVEIDVRRTADGHCILLHDDTVDRTTNGAGEVAYLNLDQVRALEIRWTPMQFIRESQFPVPPDSERFKHLKVPTLEEALERARGQVFVMLDLKAEDIEGAVQVVQSRGMLSEVIFKVNSVDEGEAVLAIAPEAVLMGRPDDEPELNAMLAAFGPPIVHLDDTTFIPPVIEQLDDAGALIWMNTLGKADAVALAADGDDLRWAERLGDDLASVLGFRFEPHVRAYRKLAERGADFLQTDNIVAVVEAMRDFRKPARRNR